METARAGRSFGLTAIGLVLGCLVASGAGAAACSNGSSAAAGGADGSAGYDGASGSDGASGKDSTTSDGTTGHDGASATDTGSDSTSATESGGGDGTTGDGGLGDGAGVVGTITIPNGDQVVSLAINDSTGRLYAGLVDGNGNSGGIAVIDTTTNTVTTTIPPVTKDGGGAIGGYFTDELLAVDSTANLVYGVRQFSSIIDVFDGATNTYKTSFDVAVLDTSCNAGIFGVQWLAIDPWRSKLYASCPGAAAKTVEIAVVSTSPTYTLVASIPLSDLQSTLGALALDLNNQLLFVSNSSETFGQSPAPPLLVDQIDTSTNTETTTAQQNLGAGRSVGTLGGAGYAALVANPLADGGTATFFSLDPGSAQLPSGYHALGFEKSFLDGTNSYTVVCDQSPANDGLSFFTAHLGPAGGPVQLGNAVPIATPLPSGEAVQVTGLVAGSTYSYLIGLAGASGSTSPIPGIWEVETAPPSAPPRPGPTISPSSGAAFNDFLASITDTSTATICYRLDGSLPTCNLQGVCGNGSITYNGGSLISINGTLPAPANPPTGQVTLTAIACDSAGNVADCGGGPNGIGCEADYVLTVEDPFMTNPPVASGGDYTTTWGGVGLAPSLATLTVSSTDSIALWYSLSTTGTPPPPASCGSAAYFSSTTVLFDGNGFDPNAISAPVTQISAMACKQGYHNSNPVNFTYTLTQAPPVVSAPGSSVTFTSPTNAFSPATATGINCSTGSQGYVYFILPDGVNQYALQQLGTPNAGPGFFGISSGTPDAGFLYANPGGTFQWGGVGNGSPFGPAGTIATTVLAPSTLDAGLGDLQVVGSWSCH